MILILPERLLLPQLADVTECNCVSSRLFRFYTFIVAALALSRTNQVFEIGLS